MSDTPEEPEEGDRDPAGGAGTGPDEPLRGWIDPDDRLWRHPSEVTAPSTGSGAGAGAGDHPPLLVNVPAGRPHRGIIMVLVGVVAVIAVGVWVVVLLSPASQRPLSDVTRDTLAGTTLSTLAGSQNAVPVAAQAAGRSMVELQATTSHGSVVLIGVAVAEGGLVATTADLLGGLKRIVMVGPDGKLEAASLVGRDTASDVALVDVPVDVPVAPFANDAGLSGGSPDLTLSYVPAGGASLALHCTAGLVTGVGAAIASGPAGGMPSITSSIAAPTLNAGDPLLNPSGDVVGLLYGPAPGSGSGVTFLPSDLVVGVADDLRSGDRVVHGLLGVQGGDAPNGSGAKVEVVKSGSPAAGRLQVGQVIVAVNALPVHSMAELRARIYVLAPGSAVAVSVQQATATKVVDLTLGGSS